MTEIKEASYNITNNRLFFWPAARLPKEEYERVKAAGFQWWPRGCFTTIWSPGAEDLIRGMGAEIVEDDTPDDLEGRVKRFEKYAERDERESEYAQQRTGEATTRRRLEQAQATATKKSEEAEYWHDRIAGAIGRAEYRDLPDVILRRIKGLEADHRKHTKAYTEYSAFIKFWQDERVITEEGRALHVANYDPLHFSMRFDKAQYPDSEYEGERSIWSALEDHTITPAQAAGIMVGAYEKAIENQKRWIDHLNMRLEYERAYLESVGGAPVETTEDGIKVGDRVQIWHQVKEVVKVNGKSVRVKGSDGYTMKVARSLCKKVGE